MDKMNIQYYSYVIVFKGSKEEIKPLLWFANISDLREVYIGHMHIFDDDLVKILPALEYCMHLPRLELDVADIEVEQMDKAYDVPQNIIMIPDEVFTLINLPIVPTIILYAEDICLSAIEKIKKEESLLEPIVINMLSEKTLINNWVQLSERREWYKGDCVPNVEMQFLLDGERMAVLPALFTARQFGRVEEVYNKIFNAENIYKECAEILWNQWAKHAALMKFSNMPEIQEEYFNKMYEKEYKNAFINGMINVVVTMPGIPRQQIKLANLSPDLSTIEKRVIRILALHRAIAKKALIIELPVVFENLFQEYNELEINCACKSGTNNQYVHRSLSVRRRITVGNNGKLNSRLIPTRLRSVIYNCAKIPEQLHTLVVLFQDRIFLL